MFNKVFNHQMINTILLVTLINPFPNKPWFLRVCSTSLLKTLWEKEKLLVTSNFSFSQWFLPICRTFCHFHPIWNCRLQTLSVWLSLKFVVWERVNSICLSSQKGECKSFSSTKYLFHCYLTLYYINNHFEASITDNFWKNCGKRKNCL